MVRDIITIPRFGIQASELLLMHPSATLKKISFQDGSGVGAIVDS